MKYVIHSSLLYQAYTPPGYTLTVYSYDSYSISPLIFVEIFKLCTVYVDDITHSIEFAV